MNPTRKIGFFILAAHWFAPLTATATIVQPVISAVANNLGGGFTAYDVVITDPSNQSGTFFLNQLTFSGPLVQQLAFGSLDVNTNADADFYSANPGAGYTKLTDSYFDSPFADNLAGTGITQTATTFAITAGSAPGQLVTSAPVAHLVAAGPISFTGVVSRGTLSEAADFTISGTLNPIPEPATAALFALGLLLVTPIVRGKRRAFVGCVKRTRNSYAAWVSLSFESESG